jgi:hypothetical protein
MHERNTMMDDWRPTPRLLMHLVHNDRGKVAALPEVETNDIPPRYEVRLGQNDSSNGAKSGAIAALMLAVENSCDEVSTNWHRYSWAK